MGLPRHGSPNHDVEGMRLALEEARKAAAIGEVPVGAVIVYISL